MEFELYQRHEAACPTIIMIIRALEWRNVCLERFKAKV